MSLLARFVVRNVPLTLDPHRRAVVDGRSVLEALFFRDDDESFERAAEKLAKALNDCFRDYLYVVFDGAVDSVRWYAEQQREQRRLLSSSGLRPGSVSERACILRVLGRLDIGYEVADYHQIPAMARAAVEFDSAVLSNDPAFFSINVPRGIIPMTEWHPLRPMQPTFRLASLRLCLIQRVKADVPMEVMPLIGQAAGDDYVMVPRYATIADATEAVIAGTYEDKAADARALRLDFMQLPRRWIEPYRRGLLPREVVSLLLHRRVTLPCFSAEDLRRTSAWSVAFRIWSALLHSMDSGSHVETRKQVVPTAGPVVLTMREQGVVTSHRLHGVPHRDLDRLFEKAGANRVAAVLRYWNDQREATEDMPVRACDFARLVESTDDFPMKDVSIVGFTRHDLAQYRAIRYSLDAWFWFRRSHGCRLLAYSRGCERKDTRTRKAASSGAAASRARRVSNAI